MIFIDKSLRAVVGLDAKVRKLYFTKNAGNLITVDCERERHRFLAIGNNLTCRQSKSDEKGCVIIVNCSVLMVLGIHHGVVGLFQSKLRQSISK